jgi:hypothetical protein
VGTNIEESPILGTICKEKSPHRGVQNNKEDYPISNIKRVGTLILIVLVIGILFDYARVSAIYTQNNNAPTISADCSIRCHDMDFLCCFRINS